MKRFILSALFAMISIVVYSQPSHTVVYANTNAIIDSGIGKDIYDIIPQNVDPDVGLVSARFYKAKSSFGEVAKASEVPDMTVDFYYDNGRLKEIAFPDKLVRLSYHQNGIISEIIAFNWDGDTLWRRLNSGTYPSKSTKYNNYYTISGSNSGWTWDASGNYCAFELTRQGHFPLIYKMFGISGICQSKRIDHSSYKGCVEYLNEPLQYVGSSLNDANRFYDGFIVYSWRNNYSNTRDSRYAVRYVEFEYEFF